MAREFGELWTAWGTELLTGGAVCAGILFLAWLLWLLRRRNAALPEPGWLDLSIDVAALGDRGPPSQGPRLEFYGTPVRLAVFVVAPAGRDGSLPAGGQLGQLVEQLVPGLTAILQSQQPLIRRWPGQLSSSGFIHAFFNHVALPGDRGKSTAWCSVAGKFRADGQVYLAGLVACAADANGLGQLEIQHEGQWNDVVRIKNVE